MIQSGSGLKQRYFSTFQLMQIVLFAGLVIVLELTLRLPGIALPGHAGLFGVTVMVVAAGIIPKPGTATLVGVTCGILGAFVGVGNFGALHTFITFAIMGIFVELVMRLPKRESLWVTVPAAILGNFGRLLARFGLALVSGAPAGVVALGFARAIIGYIIFGIIGGILAGLTLKALRRAGYFAYIADKR